MSAIARVRSRTTLQRDALLKRRGASNPEAVFNGRSNISFPEQSDTETLRVNSPLAHNRGEPYAANRPIEQRIAGQPIHVAEVVKARDNGAGKKLYAPPRPGRRRLSFEEMAKMPKWARKRIGLPTTDEPHVFVKMCKAMHSEAARVDILESHPVLELLNQPNPRLKLHTLLEISITSLQFTGKCFWWLTKSKERKKFDLWYLPTDRVREKPKNVMLDAGYLVYPEDGQGDPEEIPADRMIYFYYPDPANPMMCYPPVRAGIQAVRIDESIAVSQQQTFENGLFPYLAFITGDIIDPTGKNLGKVQYERWQLNELTARLEQLFKGPLKHGKHIVLDRTINDVKFLSNKPHEMDWTASNEFNRDRIWRIMGTPRVIAGDIQDANRATALVADEAFTSNVVNPKITYISQVMNDALLPLYAGDNEDLVLWIEEASSTDRDAELKETELLLANRGLLVDELRAKLGMPALPNGMGQVLVSTGMQIFEPVHPSAEEGITNRIDLIQQQQTPPTEAEGDEVIDVEERNFRLSDGFKSSGHKDFATAWLKIHSRNEQIFAADVKTFLNKQVSDICAKISDGADPLSAFDPRAWDERIRKMVRPNLMRALAVGAVNMLRATKQLSPMDVKADDVLMDLPPRVLTAIKKFLQEVLDKEYWSGINDTTATIFARAVETSLEEGEPLHDLVMRVKGALGGKASGLRALTIARTETTAALNSGSRAVIDDLASEGIVAGSEWLATMDEHTRTTHWVASGQKQDTDGLFTIGGHKARFPGDPDLPPEERIRCRCTLLSFSGEAKQLVAGRDFYIDWDGGCSSHKSIVRDAATLAMFSKSAEVFKRIERRYLVDDPAPILEQLLQHGKIRDYQVTTLYLDHHCPTWSVGKTAKKFRLRRYDAASGDTYFEEKFKVAGVTYKTRIQIKDSRIHKDLIPIGIVSYTRTEFEKDGCRITVDRDVKVNGRRLGKIVVEVKGDQLPDWLPEMTEAPQFSKSSALLRAL